MLFDRFREFLRKNCFTDESRKIVLAVSGGIDSVVMMHLFHQAGSTCKVAHCNFQLRGAESEADEQFVKKLAIHYQFPFLTTRFNTLEFARDTAVSIQMAARQLRYHWFDELITSHQFDAVAVAHHADDVVETMLLNLVKGTGLAGMHGIKAVHGNIIRPLLFATKKELEAYAAQHKLNWRTDASNSEVYYQRNKIRHQVIPLLEEINPELSGAFRHHAKLISGYEALLENYMTQLEAAMVKRSHKGSITFISLELLLAAPAPEIILYHFLKKYGVSGTLCEEIVASVHVGAEFYANGYKIVRDRDAITLFDPGFFTNQEYQLQAHDKSLDLPFGKLEVVPAPLTNQLSWHALPGFAEPNTAYIDASEICYPLSVRKWRKGDSFQPLGMKGRKLLSDFFIDSRFTSVMKEIVYLLISQGEVVWVIGHRIDERFKIKDSTKLSLRFSFIPDDDH